MGTCGTHMNTVPYDDDDSKSPVQQIKPQRPPSSSSSSSLETDSHWLGLQFKDKEHSKIKKPDELEPTLKYPPDPIDKKLLNRVQGSLTGLALGDALGAHVEFRPRQYLVDHPVSDLQAGGTWGLRQGQFTDDTSMALCLAISLIVCHDFSAYDQLVRYKWWYRYGYMSSTGECFDIGAATSQSLREFERRQQSFAHKYGIPQADMDCFSDQDTLKKFNVYCSDDHAAGNGGLMRLAPVPLFFYRNPVKAVQYSGISAKITHGDERAYDACRYYGALIVAALNGEEKAALLDENFYQNHKDWFRDKHLHEDILKIAEGSYKRKKKGYDDGIRGKGFVVNSLEAALWAFSCDDNSFEKGVLLAVNLGDDTDTTAAIYGQLAGAHYGYKDLPTKWTKHVYAQSFITCLSKWIVYEGEKWFEKNPSTSTNSPTATSSKVHHDDKKSSKENISSEPNTQVPVKKPFRKH